MVVVNIIKKTEAAPPPNKEINSKILVAEDDKYLRDFYRELLTEKGYQVLTAVNGQEALDLARQELPQLILLDIMMPVMDGNKVLSKLRGNEQTKKIPVIIITNAGDINNMDQAKFYGAFKFLIKSNISPEEILETVQEALRS